jgi:outer membrane murein-binding lipoprotein Lpp
MVLPAVVLGTARFAGSVRPGPRKVNDFAALAQEVQTTAASSPQGASRIWWLEWQQHQDMVD